MMDRDDLIIIIKQLTDNEVQELIRDLSGIVCPPGRITCWMECNSDLPCEECIEEWAKELRNGQ